MKLIRKKFSTKCERKLEKILDCGSDKIAELSISIDVTELDKEIEKAERLLKLLRECKKLQESEVEPISISYEKCCECPYKRCSDPIWLYEPRRITYGDGTSASPEIYRNYYTCSSD